MAAQPFGPRRGLHDGDVNLALGDLVEAVRRQAEAYAGCLLAPQALRVHPRRERQGPRRDHFSVCGIDMVKAHPYRAVGVVLAVMLVCGGTAGMIGQYDDGPWGGLPEWMAALTWFGFLGASLAMVVLTVHLLVADLRWRRERSTA